MGIVNLKWYDTRNRISDYLEPGQFEDGWPEKLTPGALTVMQRPLRPGERSGFWALGRASNLLTAIEKDCQTGQLASTTNGKENLIAASSFANWLTAQGETPSVHIADWFEAMGVNTAAATAPPTSSTSAPKWELTKPSKFQGYTAPVYELLREACTAGKTIPTAHDVLAAFKANQPAQVAKVLDGVGLDFYIQDGNSTKHANLRAIAATIKRMTRKNTK